MNRKSAGIILSIAAVALAAGLFCRPSFQPMSPERHAARPPAASSVSSPELSRVEPTVAGLSAPLAPQTRTATSSAPTTPEWQVVLSSDPSDLRLHPGERATEAKIAARYGDADLTADHPDVAAAIKIQERHPELMANPAVVGTAVGLNDDGQVALIVYTKIDAPGIPAKIEDLPVAVWRSGEFFARQDAVAFKGGGSTPSAPAVDTTVRFDRPVPLGVSTGHFAITAGTIGCRVRNAAGDKFALSNNHVYANENGAAIGDAALQPGPYDGGTAPADVLGTLAGFVTIDFSGAENLVDCAIVATSDLRQSTPTGGYGVPSTSTQSASLRLGVKKYGRTTGQTTGKVQGLNATVNVGYDAGVARFVGQIIINPGGFSAGGDSGSLIVSQTGNKPVGLLFAGSSSVTIANPIGAVLSALHVSIDTPD
jgi:hypothetical protein